MDQQETTETGAQGGTGRPRPGGSLSLALGESLSAVLGAEASPESSGTPRPAERPVEQHPQPRLAPLADRRAHLIDRSAQSRVAVWAVFAGTVGFFSALAAVYWNPAISDINDAKNYMSLATHPGHFPRAPFGFRIFAPYLVWLTHIKPLYAFTAITVLSLGAAAAFLYLYLRDLYSSRVALFGVALFMVCPAPLIELRNPVDVDALFFAMVALAFLALERKQWVLLGFALVVGVLDKETMLFVLLPLAVVAYADHRFAPTRRWAALFGLPVLAFVLVHYTPIVFRPAPHNYNFFSVANISFVLNAEHLINGGGDWYSFFWSLVDTFGALWVLAILLVGRSGRLVRQTAVFIVPVLASVLIATDWSRMMAVGFIVIIPLVCAATLERALPALVLFFCYSAVVVLGIDNPRLHPALDLDVPLIVVSLVAALLVVVPRPSRRLVPAVIPAISTAVARNAGTTVVPRPATKKRVPAVIATSEPGRRWLPVTPPPAARPASPPAPVPVRPAAAEVAPPQPPVRPAAAAPAAARPATAFPPTARPAAPARRPTRPAAPAPAQPAARLTPPPLAARPAAPPPAAARPAPQPAVRPAAQRARRARPPAPAPAQPAARLAPSLPTARLAAPTPSAAAAPGPAAPSPVRPRSEAVVHLEIAEGLLADVQRLVERAGVGSGESV
ncbi:MAG TPA: glycosyltransferase family 39 protein [Acidimicrobiales bacterium]|nr:glycosyltransferase family 39 protein [Acidimicrobiales bacterium]